MEESLKELIQNEYDLIQNRTDSSILCIQYNSIIQIKINSELHKKFSIFLDLKELIRNEIDCLDLKQYQYGDKGFQFIIAYLEFLTDEEVIAILEYSIQKLRNVELNKESLIFEELLFRKRLKVYWKDGFWKNFFKILRTLINFNLFSLLLFLVLAVGIFGVILMPAPAWSISLFKIQQNTIFDNFYTNTLANVYLWVTGLTDDFKVIPNNFVGVLLLVSFKIVLLGTFIDFGFEKIKRKLGL